MTAPTNVAPDQARHDYIARVYKMTHAELFNELMRVHTEANRLVIEAVAAEREACAQLCEAIEDDDVYTGQQYADQIRARGQE